MNKAKFTRYMQAAEKIGGDYSRGYQRGLRRLHHGENFGTDDEHAKWLSLDGRRQEMGDGYRDGYAGNPPRGMHGNTGNRHAANDIPLDAHINQRVNSREKSGWVKQAQREGKKLGPWIRSTLNAATDDDLK